MGSFAAFMAQAIENLVFKPLAWVIDLVTDILKESVEDGIDSVKRALAKPGEGDRSQPQPPANKKP